MSDRIESRLKEERRFHPSAAFADRARVTSHHAYAAMYRQSLEEPEVFWREQTADLVWRTPWTKFSEWTLAAARSSSSARSSTSPRAASTGTSRRRGARKAAIVWEGEPGDTRTLTYFELHREVVRARRRARATSASTPGDRVAIYMGMVPEAAVAMLACARIGAHPLGHLRRLQRRGAPRSHQRLRREGARSRRTARGAAATSCRSRRWPTRRSSRRRRIEKVVVLRRIGARAAPVAMKEGRDVWWHDCARREAERRASLERAKQPEAFDAEHPLFILYTSGSTGKPKGVLHTTRRLPRRRARHDEVRLRSARRATSTGAPPTSAGSPATATSCTARSRAARRA